MMHTVILAAVVGQAQLRELPSGRELLDVIRSVHESVQTVAFTYEGVATFASDAPQDNTQPTRFQGVYFARRDDTELLDIYIRGASPDTLLLRSIYALHDRKMETLSFTPDSVPTPRQNPVIRDPASTASLDMPMSPHRLFYHWLFRWLPTLTDLKVDVEGWEDVNDRRCIKFHVDKTAKYRGQWKRTARYWVDLERGATPLKVEQLVDGKRFWLVTDVRQEEFPLSNAGASAWLPIASSCMIYGTIDDLKSEPTTKEEYRIVRGSVRINQPFSDRLFQIKNHLGKSAPGSVELAGEFAEAAARAVRTREPTDPDSIRRELDRGVAALDPSTRASNAVESANAENRTFIYAQAILVVAGMIAIAAGWVLRSKSRR